MTFSLGLEGIAVNGRPPRFQTGGAMEFTVAVAGSGLGRAANCLVVSSNLCFASDAVKEKTGLETRLGTVASVSFNTEGFE
jgi:hypothetical protein